VSSKKVNANRVSGRSLCSYMYMKNIYLLVKRQLKNKPWTKCI